MSLASKWGSMNTPENGDKLLLQFLSSNQAAIGLFDTFKGKSAAQLEGTKELRDVSKRIMSKLDEFIKAGGSPNVSDFVKEHKARNVTPAHFEALKGVAAQVFAGAGDQAMGDFAKVIDTIKAGY